MTGYRPLKWLLLVAVAILATSVMVQAEAQEKSGSAAEQHRIVIMSDDDRDLVTTTLSDQPAVSYWYVGQVRQADPSQPAPIVPGLRITALQEAKSGEVKIKLAVLTGRWIYNVPPSKVKEKSLNTYSITESSPITVKDGVRFGLPVLHFRLGREEAQCPGDPSAVENRTAAIKVEGFPAVRGWCYLSVRNTSSKGIAGIGVTREGGRRGGPSPEGSLGNPLAEALIKPGETYLYITNTSAQPGQDINVTKDHLTINYVVFQDGSYEGDEAKAMQWAGYLAGFYAGLAKFAPVLRDMLAQSSYTAHESAFVDDLRVKVSGLPEFDAEVSQKVEAQLRPTDPYNFRIHLGNGMRAAKQQISRWIDGYASPKNKKDRKVSFRSYWESVLSQADAAVDRWNMAGADQRNVAGQP
jgi:hypothetical protein